MNDFDALQLAALARRLDLAPRALLLAAARLACETSPATPERRAEVLAQARAGAGAAAAALLLTPVASFAQDEVERALASLWPGAA